MNKEETFKEFVQRTYSLLLMHVVGYTLIGVLFNPFLAVGLSVGKELGELKGKVEGSIKDKEKWVKMFKELFMPKVLIQWLPSTIILGVLYV